MRTFHAKGHRMQTPTIVILYFRCWGDGKPYHLVFEYNDGDYIDYVFQYADAYQVF